MSIEIRATIGSTEIPENAVEFAALAAKIRAIRDRAEADRKESGANYPSIRVEDQQILSEMEMALSTGRGMYGE